LHDFDCIAGRINYMRHMVLGEGLKHSHASAHTVDTLEESRPGWAA